MFHMEQISFDYWQKIEMRVGEIIQVERVVNSDKLYKLQVNIGKENPIQIISGIVPYYTQEELLHKKIIVLVNLAPATIRGEMSQGMLLAAGSHKEDRCVLLTVEKDIEVGTIIT